MNKKFILLLGSGIVLAIILIVLSFGLVGGQQKSNPTPVFSNNKVGNSGAYTPPQNTAQNSNQSLTASNTTKIAPSSQIFGPVTIYAPVNGWYLVENSVAKVSIKFPKDWEISAINTDQSSPDYTPYYLASGTSTDKGQAIAYVNHYPNPQGLSPGEWVKNNLGISNFTNVTIGAAKGISYTDSNATSTDDKPYVGVTDGLIVANGGEIIDVHCSTSGNESESLVSVCKDIVNSFVLEK